MKTYRNRARHSRGFTLVEMLVVLAILVALASIAVTSLEGVQDQARNDATQRGMQSIEDAVLGQQNLHTPDGVPVITGFVADIGRLPKAAIKTVNGVSQTQPQELWDNPYGLAAFGIKQAVIGNIPTGTAGTAPTGDEDSEVYVPCGWRGPYLRLGIGQSALADGWGNPFELLKVDRTPVAVTPTPDEISIVRSLGVDNVRNSTATNDYREDVYVNFNTSAFSGASTGQEYPAVSASDNYHAPLTVSVRNYDASPISAGVTVTLKYYGPDPATGKIKVFTSAQTVATSSANITFVISDPAITIGSRVLRAYDGTRKSAATPVVLLRTGNSQELVLY